MRTASILLVLFLLGNKVFIAQPLADVRLVEIKYDSVTTTIYSYNDANMISEEQRKHQYTKYHYNDKNQVISVDYYVDMGMYSSSTDVIKASRERKEWVNPENTEGSTKTYEYNNMGQVIKSTTNTRTDRYIYDKNNRIIAMEIIGNGSTTLSEYSYDKKGNLTKQSNYYMIDGKKQCFTEAIYTFDNKPNPYKTFNNLMIPGEYTNPNNIVKRVEKNYYNPEKGDGEAAVFEFVNTYEYSKYGYPEKNDKYVYIYK